MKLIKIIKDKLSKKNKHEDYVIELKDFRRRLTDMIENCEDREPLYEKNFTISFNGLSIKIGFGATEFYAIQNVLDQIIDEQE